MIVRRILVIDPDIEIGKLYEERFRKAGHIVLYTNNPKMALEFSRSLQPDMILLDPEFEGQAEGELLRKLLSTQETAHIPVLVTKEGFIHEQLKQAHKERLEELPGGKESDELLKKINEYFEALNMLWAESMERKKKAEEEKRLVDQNRPKIPAPEIKKEAQETPAPALEPEPSEDQDAPRYRVAIIADDPFFVRVYDSKLSQAGFAADSAANPEMPFEFIDQMKPHVIVTTLSFFDSIAERYKTQTSKPIIIVVNAEEGSCPKQIEDFKGVCIGQENMTPARLIGEIDRLMSMVKS